MRTRISKLTVIPYLLCSVVPLLAQDWSAVPALPVKTFDLDNILLPEDPTEIHEIKAITADPASGEILYAAINTLTPSFSTLNPYQPSNRIYRFPTDNAAWQLLYTAPPSTDSFALEIGLAADPYRPQRIYLGITSQGEDGGVYRSEDGGASWRRVDSSLPSGAFGNKVALTNWSFDPQDAEIVYGGGYSLAYKSDNGGDTWEALEIPSNGPTHLAVAPNAPDCIYAGTPSGVFKSTDAGATWSPTSLTASAVQILVVDQTDADVLYIGAGNGTLLISRDGGQTTETADLPRQVGALLQYPANPAVLFVGTANGVFISQDKGNHWAPWGFSRPVDQLALGGQGPHSAYALSQGRIYRTNISENLFTTVIAADSWGRLKRRITLGSAR